MKRKIITIDEAACTGCGLCADACHEGAIGMVDGKARLLRDDYCDGLGDCLPACPAGAITFEEREAADYDEAAVEANKAARAAAGNPVRAQRPEHRDASGHVSSHAMSADRHEPLGGCPGSRVRTMNRTAAPSGCPSSAPASFAPASAAAGVGAAGAAAPVSELTMWPVQIKLAPPRAPFFDGARLLIAADCTAFSRADFHERFIRGRVCLIGCPKLDAVDYSEKLTAIIRDNDIKDVTVVRMEVPCCGGISHAVQQALLASGKMIPWQVVTIATTGEILDR